MSTEEENLIKAIGELNLAGEDNAFLVAVSSQVLALGQMISAQNEMISGVMLVVDAAMTLNKQHNDRLMALEARARGLSFEELVDGKEVPPLGPTREHYEELEKINALLDGLVNRSRNSDN